MPLIFLGGLFIMSLYSGFSAKSTILADFPLNFIYEQ